MVIGTGFILYCDSEAVSKANMKNSTHLADYTALLFLIDFIIIAFRG
jgi:hypothetical protein